MLISPPAVSLSWKTNPGYEWLEYGPEPCCTSLMVPLFSFLFPLRSNVFHGSLLILTFHRLIARSLALDFPCSSNVSKDAVSKARTMCVSSPKVKMRALCNHKVLDKRLPFGHEMQAKISSWRTRLFALSCGATRTRASIFCKEGGWWQSLSRLLETMPQYRDGESRTWGNNPKVEHVEIVYSIVCGILRLDVKTTRKSGLRLMVGMGTKGSPPRLGMTWLDFSSEDERTQTYAFRGASLHEDNYEAKALFEAIEVDIGEEKPTYRVVGVWVPMSGLPAENERQSQQWMINAKISWFIPLRHTIFSARRAPYHHQASCAFVVQPHSTSTTLTF